MKVSVSKNNRVFFGNQAISYYHYLVAIRNSNREFLGCYIIEQAYSGRDTRSARTRIYNQVQRHLSEMAEKTHLRYTLEAWGSREVCLKVARRKGWEVT